MKISTFQAVAETAQAITTTAAIFAGGVWTYFRFIKNRLRYPKAEVHHDIFSRELTAGKTLIHVVMTVVNRGDVLLPVSHAWTRLLKIAPVSGGLAKTLEENLDPIPEGEAEIEWPEIGCREVQFEKGQAEIEPGEVEKFHFDFIFDSGVQVVEIYSYFENSRKKKRGPMGWALTSIYDLRQYIGGSNGNEASSAQGPTLGQTPSAP